MTRDKALKRATRSRMSKTGERYTTARHYALDLHRNQQDVAAGAVLADRLALPEADAVSSGNSGILLAESPLALTLPSRIAEPGVSDAAVQRATGKAWDEWLALLDAWGALQKTHPEIARYVQETFGISGWWAQNVTVGYERARGMRALHERPDGFSVNASKTFPVGAGRLFAAFLDGEERNRWLDGLALRTRSSQPIRSARFDVLPGETRLNVTFVAKGPEKSAAQLQQEPDEVERWRAIWKARLARLAAYLGDGA